MKKKKILILINDLSFFSSHRLPIAQASKANGYDVVIGYGELGSAEPKIFEQIGLDVNFIPMLRGSINPLNEIKTTFYIWKFFKKIKPDIVHLVTVKPNLYGGIISRLVGVPCVVSAVSGLGTLFAHKDLKIKLLRTLLSPIYRLALSHINQKIIVQNEEDSKVLVNKYNLDPSKVILLKGSGVKLENFTSFDEPGGKITVCFAARLLRDKGIYEFVSAARILKNKGIKARFCIAGNLDTKNPSGLNMTDINKIKESGCIEFLGYQKDIAKLYAQSHIVCLPSYHEGLPKSLIEAAAASRAIVTTDIPGCRNAIIPNITGLLVPLKDHQKLADALERLIKNPKERINMGKAGRKFAEREFPIEKIVQSHLDIFKELLNKAQ